MTGDPGKYHQARNYIYRYKQNAKRYAERIRLHAGLRYRLFRKWFKRASRPENVTAWATVAIFLVTGATVGILILQWIEFRETDIAGRRAWLGPYDANILGTVEKGKGFDIQIDYLNTGKEPALDVLLFPHVWVSSKTDWNNFVAARKISDMERACLRLNELQERGTRVAYPSGGNTNYHWFIKTSGPGQTTNIVATEDTISGDSILVLQACFVYRTVEEVHHSAACYYYQSTLARLPGMNICTVGNNAD